MRILLADDDKNFGFIMKSELEDAGYSVDIVNDGVEALMSFIENDYKLVLLDLRMPALNGIDTLKVIKKLNNTVPAITFSSIAGDKEKAESIKAGALKCFSKPFEISKLKMEIGKHI